MPSRKGQRRPGYVQITGDRSRVPSSSPTLRMTLAQSALLSASDCAGRKSASSEAASKVPPHVRKAFGVNRSEILGPVAVERRDVRSTSSPSRS